jgi:hypothetical protein
MRHSRIPLPRVILASVLGCCVSGGAYSQQPLELTRKLLDQGAVSISLTRIEQQQPAVADNRQWAGWQQLRLEALLKSSHHSALPPAVSQLLSRQATAHIPPALLLRTSQAILTTHPALAQQLVAATLWHQTTSSTQQRELRLVIIRSYLLQQQAMDAYKAMLRFQQDYPTHTPPHLGDWLNSLLALNAEQEALTWLPQLQDNPPLQARLQLQLGQTTAADILTRAQAGQFPASTPDYLRLMQQVAQDLRHNELALWVSEQMLASGTGAPAPARALWDDYLREIDTIASTHHLISGDDNGWLQTAQTLQNTHPIQAHALWIGIITRSQQADTRIQAQNMLAQHYQQQGLTRVALALFQLPGMEPVSPALNAMLGDWAERQNHLALASHFWRNHPAAFMPGNEADKQLRLLAAHLGSDEPQRSHAPLRALAAIPLNLEQATRAIQLLRQHSTRIDLSAMQPLLEQISQAPDAELQSTGLMLSGQLALARQDYTAAAHAYLLASLRSPRESLARQARTLGSEALRLAGRADEAQAIADWQPPRPVQATPSAPANTSPATVTPSAASSTTTPARARPAPQRKPSPAP